MKTRIGKRCALLNNSGLRFVLPSVANDATGCEVPVIQAFAIEYSGQLYAYENRCPHLGVELDWAPTEFFDKDGEWLVCSTHGARFEPDTGRCVSGPCAGQALTPVSIHEKQGELYT